MMELTAQHNGRVALVTGAARGQGRAIAKRLAQSGLAIIALDLCDQVTTVPYEMSTRDDLDQTVEEVKALGGTIFAAVRDQAQLDDVVAGGVERFGRLDVVSAGAGICSGGPSTLDIPEESWQDIIDIDLTGVWHSCRAAVPAIRRTGEGGSIVLTGSIAGMKAVRNTGAYVAAKHGVIGLTRVLAMELAADNIRVNCVNPTTVDTPMAINEAAMRVFSPDLDHPTVEDMAAVSLTLHALPVPWVHATDIAELVNFLASDAGRFITGACIPVDAGLLVL
jgi:(+)-trans-carveol dehydrogenase